MADLGFKPRDYLMIIMFIVGLFGGRKKKKIATRLFPLAASAMDQWERGGVPEALDRVSEQEPALAQFRATCDEGFAILREGL
jgi:hypothetical protein